ncbi:hypothetical protein C8D87_1162 [Lentzea atacamensis]|uniref:ATP-binding protein n=2 Tax=Lentzea atacamensis TaxID=531938 RepID=A0ABX9DYI5_9PSEU|nr:hypothetical protein C8D87_1162 [Lentzea atacamensis]
MPFELDSDGFLSGDFSLLKTGQEPVPGALLTPEAAAAGGALVLLGEPGVGKSSAIRSLTAELPCLDDVRGAAPMHAMLWVDGADLIDASFDGLVGCELAALHSTDETCLRRLTLVLDQLDESPMLDRLPGRLDRVLRRVAPGTVRILVACRTADFRQVMREVLARHFEKCVLADLAPLSRADAVLLAGTKVDGEALVDAAVAVGAGSLASVPLTLELLVRMYEREDQLFGDAVALFKQGIWQLAEEPDPDRPHNVHSVEQRLAIAGRVAARLLLSGRRSVWLGSGLEAGQSDLVAGTVAGGVEQTLSGPFDVREDGVRETLGTALFTAHGQGRLGFRHSSLAAYLAADYVRRRNLPRHQLTSLFLVDAADQDTASIPVPLRETAAWLVALDPSNTEWLAAADPESLMAHSAIVSSDAIRALVVRRLLDRADQVELSETGWRPGRWRVGHPGLAEQLRQVLEPTVAEPPEGWLELARIQLAVRLARDSAVSELAETLLKIAEHPEWDTGVRQLAARTALEAHPNVAVPRLRALLQTLLDPAGHQADQYDELEGLLLQILWPDHLAIDELLLHVRAPSLARVISTYVLFLHGFAESVEETDLPALLEWSLARARRPVPASHFAPVSSADPAEHGLGAEPGGSVPHSPVPDYVVEAVAERALGSVSAFSYVDAVALMLWPRLSQYDRVAIPAPMDLVAADGTELDQARSLRRALARSLVTVAVKESGTNPPDIWAVVDGWQSVPRVVPKRYATGDGRHRGRRTALVDANDFEWALNEAGAAHSAGEEDVAEAMGRLAAYLFDGFNRNSFELAYARQDSPAWEHLRWIYDGVPLDSPYAETLRRAARHSQPKVWDQSAEFIDAQRQRLILAGEGDSHAFWQLLWNLQFDPFTGEERFIGSDDDVRSFTGFAVLGDAAENAIRAAGHLYLAAEHDHRDSWLGEAKINYLAWAGCMTLVLLQRTDRLEEVDPARWHSWAGALLSPCTGANGGDRLARRKQLLQHAARHAPGVVAAALRALVEGALARGEHPIELNHFDVRLGAEIADMTAALVSRIGAALGQDPDRADAIAALATTQARAIAVTVWAELVGQLIVGGDGRGAAAARVAIGGSGPGKGVQDLAVVAARVLLYQDAQEHWPFIAEVVVQSDTFGREVALACSSKDVRDQIMSQLSEQQLAEVHRWLSALFDPSQDPDQVSSREITPEASARSWRDDTVRALWQRATEASVRELRRLAAEDPANRVVAAALVNVRRQVQATRWLGGARDGVLEMLADPSRRLVRTTAELLDLLLDTLKDIAEVLPAHGELLWDRIPAPRRSAHHATGAEGVAGRACTRTSETWRPKPEAALCSYLANQLELRLANRGLVINREVLVLPRDAYGAGDRPDILVQADATRGDSLPTDGPTVAKRLSVAIEIKGAWNRDLMTSQRTQLATRYLPAAHTDAGLYVVGVFPIDQWTATGDTRKAAAKKFTDDRVNELTGQALELRHELGVRTEPFVMIVERPHPADS